MNDIMANELLNAIESLTKTLKEHNSLIESMSRSGGTGGGGNHASCHCHSCNHLRMNSSRYPGGGG
jgi:hypothetical protein